MCRYQMKTAALKKNAAPLKIKMHLEDKRVKKALAGENGHMWPLSLNAG